MQGFDAQSCQMLKCGYKRFKVFYIMLLLLFRFLTDADLKEFLEYMKLKGHLDNTLLLVMGDHGARFSTARKTLQGKLEERLPMMSLTFPDKIKVRISCIVLHVMIIYTAEQREERNKKPAGSRCPNTSSEDQ